MMICAGILIDVTNVMYRPTRVKVAEMGYTDGYRLQGDA